MTIDESSKPLQFQVEPTCKEEGSMVGGSWSLYTKRSCQGGGEVKRRIVYICLCIHFVCICLRVTGQDRTMFKLLFLDAGVCIQSYKIVNAKR